MPLSLYNSLTKQKEVFTPLTAGEVEMYTCGPTVYDFAHIGNMRAYICADLIKRVFQYNGLKVKQIINITDVGHLTSDSDTGEDKLEKGAKREGKTVWEVARYYEDLFRQNFTALNCLEPDIWSRATEHIKEMIALIKKLEEKGLTYQTSRAIYFDISKYPDYTKLSGQKLEEKKTGARRDVEIDPEKKNPQDFALWFFLVGKYAEHQMKWPSPWGEGFPGWHIECSAMSMKYLGEHFDIHTGGIDHLPVHHTNERAQNWGMVGDEVVRYWLHYDFLVMGNSEKMAKSGENFITSSSLAEKGFGPLDYRYFCLSAHYRKSLNFSWEAMEGAKNAFKKLADFVINSGEEIGEVCDGCNQKFLTAINDDFNTPQALAVVWELVNSDKENSKKLATLLKFDEVLGLRLGEMIGKKIDIPREVLQLAEERKKAKEQKDYALADEIRGKIEEMGYEIEDTKDGSRIKRK